jgi:pimeloyl-ACP methyl ester carboxylesterase
MRLELPQGPIHYRDVGSGPTVVFVHGLLINSQVWSGVVERLSATHRCVVPEWPLDSHPEAMAPDADLSSHGLAKLIADSLERLALTDVTLVGNDSGGGLSQLVAARHPERVGRLVLTTCDAFEYFPPPAFKYLLLAARIPGVMALLSASMRAVPVMQRLPIAYGHLTKSRIPQALLREWVAPSASADIRRDVGKFLRSIDSKDLCTAAETLKGFKKPVLLVWTPEDTWFPVKLAHRLREAMPHAQLELVSDARVFVGIDQPEKVAELIAAFASAHGREGGLTSVESVSA